MKAISVIWNSMNEHVNEALNDIEKYAIIEDIISVDFKEDFPNFIRKIYPYTGKDIWKVNYKIENMEKYDNKNITIIFLDIDNEKNLFLFPFLYVLSRYSYLLLSYIMLSKLIISLFLS